MDAAMMARAQSRTASLIGRVGRPESSLMRSAAAAGSPKDAPSITSCDDCVRFNSAIS
jgi:hypothetical protein